MNSSSVKRGDKKDQIGRLDHTKDKDQRAKQKRDWLDEAEEYYHKMADLEAEYSDLLPMPGDRW